MHAADETVLRLIERKAFDPQIVEAVVEAAAHELGQPEAATVTRREQLKLELQRVQSELARYVAAIAEAGPLESLLESIRSCEERRAAIRKELRLLRVPKEPAESGFQVIRTRVSKFLGEWRRVGRKQVTDARRLLRTGHVRTYIIQVRDFIAR